MTEVVLPTLAFVAIWAFVALLAAGCGLLVRQALLSAFGSRPESGLRRCDVWIGLAALAAYLLAWNMVLAITWWTWALPLAAAGWGVARGVRGELPARLDRRGVAVLGAVGAGWVFLADQALGRVDDYDFGLYHAGLIAYAEKYAAIPGLANLHSRLGAGDVHLLLTAFLDRGPLAGLGPHLAGGLLSALLLLEIGLRVLRPGGQPSFTRRLAVLLVPATIALVVDSPLQRISSPNLDMAAFAAVAAGALYLAESVEGGFAPEAALTATAALALASATRPLYWLFTAFAVAVFLGSAARRGARQILGAAALVCLLPAALALGWAGRQAVLSGYPFFPVTTAHLSADWRVPSAVVVAQNRSDDAWARIPDVDPTTVLASWHWLGSWWIPARERDPDVIAPLMVLASAVTVLAGFGVRDPGRRARAGPMLAVVVPSLATLGVWFLIAPDPRFVFAPMWLVAAGLVAWALPPLPRLSRRWVVPLVGATALAATGLALVGIDDYRPTRMLPAAITLWVGATVLVLVTRRRGAAAPLAYGALVAAALAGISVAVDAGDLGLARANGSGPLGVPAAPAPTLEEVVTGSGLRLTRPVGSDQCFSVALCIPSLIDAGLHLRGAGVGDGFSVARAP